ncbi:MAG: MarR family winged helix-turn-helix transcriptional regulator [Candidatus Izemoplasmatales bacterium]|jgi:DNA-binding MarR family transcriptional regulator|nr:MarR family winged helix-turn-helix transcriptional regulator [Candidatus Izemoplasmatales bacterium]MDD3864929.1 MarR family winged helix-turn-helix transcriptional regulator [Candidatus Izemoplasmatales bacterium]
MSEAKTLINELLVDIFNRILAIEGEELKNNGVRLSMSEVHVLEAISLASEPSMSAIAKKLGITVGSATTAINTLVQKGYVSRRSIDRDRRKVLVSLEKPALEVLRIHDYFHEKMIDSIFTDLHVDEDEVLITSLKKVASYFRK